MRPLLAIALGLTLVSSVSQGAETEGDGLAPTSVFPTDVVDPVKPLIGVEFVANDQLAQQRRALEEASQQILGLTRQVAEGSSERAQLKAQWWTMFILTMVAVASAAYLGTRPASAASAPARTPSAPVHAVHAVPVPAMTKSAAHRASFPHRNSSSGFSLLEVMICVAVLGVGLSAVLSNTYTLSLGQQLVKESSTAREIARLMSERIQGASWDSLGRRDDSKFLLNAWSWHRKRANSTMADIPLDGDGIAGIRPMTDVPVGAGADGLLGTADDVTGTSAGADGIFGTADDKAVTAYHSLIALGIVPARTGLKNLRVYLEYYDQSAFDDTVLASNPFAQWQTQVALPTGGANVLSEDPDVFDLRSTNEVVLVRLVIVWTSSGGGDMTHELVLCRRK